MSAVGLGGQAIGNAVGKTSGRGTQTAAELRLPAPEEYAERNNADTAAVTEAQTAPAETPVQTQKTASTGETVINDNPAQHTPEEQRIIDEYKASNNNRLKSFIEKVRNLKNQDYKNKVREVIDTSTSRAVEKAAELTGVDTAGYQNIINGSAVQHIDNRHGENGSADKSMAKIEDFSRIGYVLDNFKDAEIVPISSLDEETAKLTKAWKNSDNTPSPLIRFSMPINGTYYIVEAVPSSKAKVMAVVSAYIGNEKNSGSINQVLNMGNNLPPQLTPAAMLDSVASATESLSQPADGSQEANAGQSRYDALQLPAVPGTETEAPKTAEDLRLPTPEEYAKQKNKTQAGRNGVTGADTTGQQKTGADTAGSSPALARLGVKIAEPITDTVRADQMVEYAKGAENSISHDLAEPDDYIINSECRYFREHSDKGRRRSKGCAVFFTLLCR